MEPECVGGCGGFESEAHGGEIQKKDGVANLPGAPF